MKYIVVIFNDYTSLFCYLLDKDEENGNLYTDKGYLYNDTIFKYEYLEKK